MSSPAPPPPPPSIKCTPIGDIGVGKTCCMLSYATKSFPHEYVPSIQNDYEFPLTVDGITLRLHLWDTNLYGGEDNPILRPLAYPSTDVFIIAFSIVSHESFTNVKAKWIVELKQYDSKLRTPILLVGMKADLRKDEEMMKQLAEKGEEMVTEEEARAYAEEIGAAGYFECSALRQEGLTPLFEEVVRLGRVKQASEPEKKTCIIL